MDQREDWHITEKIAHESGRGDPFAAAIRGTRMPMVITDPRRADNPIVFANKAFQNLTGYSRDEIVGRNCRFLQGPDSNTEETGKIGAAIRAGEPCEVELLNYRKDGTTFWNALFISPVRSEAGEIQFFFGSQLDITERVRREQEVIREKERIELEVQERTAELQSALTAKTALLTELDHRVKNNLTMIGSLLRLQSRSLSGPELRAALEEILIRVDALGIVHRHLFRTGNLTSLDLAAFAKDLFSEMPHSSSSSAPFMFSVYPASIDANLASATGLLLNEIAYQARSLGVPIHADLGTANQTVYFQLSAKGADLKSKVTAPGEMASALVERLTTQSGAHRTWPDDSTVRVELASSEAEAS